MTSFRLRIPLTPALRRELAAELERRVFFISAEIIDFDLIEESDEIVAVDLVSHQPLDPAAFTAKVNFVVSNDVAVQRVTRPKQIWRSSTNRVATADVFAELTARDMACPLGEGQVAVAEPLIGLMDYFDAALKSILAENFAVREYRYPTLVPTSAIADCGYFTSFPQYVMLVTRLHGDVDVYRAIQDQREQDAQIDASILLSCDNVDYCLPPTMCFHTFGQYRGRELDDQALTVVTARGKSFRFESRYSATLERLWDFTIREIVFLGPRRLVVEARERFMNCVFGFIDQLDLAGVCEVGNDPFFCNPDTADRVWSQRLLELKYELRLPIEPNRTVAVGSFNFHEDFFGASFDITLKNGELASSGCVGVGLERLAYAFLCQYGIDPAGWPLMVGKAVAGVPILRNPGGARNGRAAARDGS